MYKIGSVCFFCSLLSLIIEQPAPLACSLVSMLYLFHPVSVTTLIGASPIKPSSLLGIQTQPVSHTKPVV